MSLCGARWGAPRRSVRATVKALALTLPPMGERAGGEVVGGTQEELSGDVADVEGGVPQGASQFEEVSGGPEDIGRWGEVRR